MPDSAKTQIEEMIALYAKSIDAADTQLAASIWLTSPTASFIHPRGHERGWEEIKRNFYQLTMGEQFSSRKLSTRNLSIQVLGGSCAIAEFYWRFDAVFRDSGSPLTAEGRETQVFYKDPESGWQLVHVHYSSMPVNGEREGF